MSLKSRLRSVWNDPVWSKVIAAALLSGFAFLASQFLRRSSPITRTSYTAWAVLTLVVLLAALAVWRMLLPARKTLVFLSAGGTCRDPMAKAIMTKLLEGRKFKHPIDIRAVALGPVSENEASFAARHAIMEIYGEDLLRDHRPESLTPELAKQADLILVMDKLLLPEKTLPKGKTFVLKEFLGKSGDVDDPWPDGKDAATLSRYKRCADELRQLLTENLDHRIRVLDL